MKGVMIPLALSALVVCAGTTSLSAQSTTEAPLTANVPDSLMFSVDELNELRARFGSGEAAGRGVTPADSIDSASLYLSTIVFYSPAEWTIWVNGIAIGPRQDLQSFEVTDIGPDYVDLLVPLSAQGMKPVRLAPNQTFIARSGAVVEGKWKN